MLETLMFKTLHDAVAGDVAAIRTRTRLQPAGGPGDKVFPPTFAVEGRAETKYALEIRRVDGTDVCCALLDSVASQANRMEEALYHEWEERELQFPVISVDFSGIEELADLGAISTLQAPHRVFDALLRDSVDENGTLFRDTEIGRGITGATTANSTPLYHTCPTALVFGSWDSTGPRGGMGTKFQRTIVSEIVAVYVRTGVKTASRIDPASIAADVKVYHHKNNPDDYTVDESEAAMDKKGKPVPFSRRGGDGKGKPSAINHSNIAPSIDTLAGGVTFDYALQTAVLSLPALRRLRFPTTVDGRGLAGEDRLRAEAAARTSLAALALAAMAFQRSRGFDLRSRCALVPEGDHVLEFVPANGEESKRFALSAESARSLLDEARTHASELGFGWEREPVVLKPAPKLAALIGKSRELLAAGADETE